jgi:hypothetical protein
MNTYFLLSDETRKDKKILLLVSTIAIAIGVSGIVPAKITALGLEFSFRDRVGLLWVIAGVVSYFAIAFILHAREDYTIWKEAHSQEVEALETVIKSGEGNLSSKRAQLVRSRDIEKWTRLKVVYFLFELVVPLVVAMFAILTLAMTNLDRSVQRDQSSLSSTSVTEQTGLSRFSVDVSKSR